MIPVDQRAGKVIEVNSMTQAKHLLPKKTPVDRGHDDQQALFASAGGGKGITEAGGGLLLTGERLKLRRDLWSRAPIGDGGMF